MAASLGELGRAVGALERIAELAGSTASSSGAAGASRSLAWALRPGTEAEEACLAQGQQEPSVSGRVEFCNGELLVAACSAATQMAPS